MKISSLALLITHSLVIVAAGHGVGPHFFLDYFTINQVFSGDWDFSVGPDYPARLPFVGMLSIIGKSILLVALMVKRKKRVYQLMTVGLSILLFFFALLTLGDWGYQSLFRVSFLSGLPFFVSVGWCISKLLRFRNVK
jgi:hypothetical protein